MATANDSAWAVFVEREQIILDGRTILVDASRLKEVTGREPRLLAKFNLPSEVPRVLRDANYSILPIAHGTYALVRCDIFAAVKPCTIKKPFQCGVAFPLLTVGRGTGESEYLDNAFNCGIIEDFVGAKRLYLTIRGRERSASFGYSAGKLKVNVKGVQIEVDAGYEGERDIVLVEAKIGTKKFFNIRQLYYPYRHFSQVAPAKRVRPVYFEYDLVRATYTLREYAFPDRDALTCITAVNCAVYTLPVSTLPLRLDALIDPSFATPATLVPQADDLNKVLELLTVINSGSQRVDEIADYFVFDTRQSNYYGEAAEYLGLVTRRQGVFRLTQRGLDFLATPPERQRVFMAKAILNSWLFEELLAIARRKGSFGDVDIERLIGQSRNDSGEARYSKSTLPRRAKTVRAWLKWISNELGVIEINSNRYSITR